MTISSQLLFFFSLLGAFNGLLVSAWLFTRKPVNLANRFLALLLLMISVRIGKSVFLFFTTDLADIYRHIGLSACFLIGPCLYFYCRAASTQNSQKQSFWRWHMAALVTLVLTAALLFPYGSNTAEFNRLMYQFINYSWLIYLLLSLPLALPAIKDTFKISESNSDIKNKQDSHIMASAWIGTFCIWLAYFTSNYTSYIVGALSFSFLLYLSIMLMIYERKQQLPRYQNKKIEGQQANSLIANLHYQLEVEKRFKDANLTLPQLAKLMKISVPQLSQLLNDNLESSFNHYINQYRINEAKRMLESAPQMSLELIAEQSGFNSQSTFYNAFKRIENTTPARYRQQLEVSATDFETD